MIACFGEIMFRISPQDDSSLLEQTAQFNMVPGGSESNVAIALAGLGNSVTMLTQLPKSALGRAVIRYLRWHLVETDRIILSQAGRMGLYFTQRGSGVRGSRVLYDREGAAYNFIGHSSLNIDSWLKQVSWLHISGIALATSREAADFALRLVQAASKRHIPISLDINHRSLLWQWCRTTNERCRYVQAVARLSTILLGNETDLEVGLFGKKRLKKKALMGLLSKLVSQSSIQWIALSQRRSLSADCNDFGGILYEVNKRTKSVRTHIEAPIRISHIVDRIGSGDAFSAGIVDSFIRKLNPHTALRRAVILGVLKHGIRGDACVVDAHTLDAHMDYRKGEIVR